jgi:hypothetical protein
MLLSRIPCAWNVFVLTGYTLAGFFMALYVRALTRSGPAAALAGVAYALSTLMIVHVRHPNMVHTAAWWPAALLGLEHLRTRVSTRNVTLTALVVALGILSGYPAFFVYAALVTVAYVIVRRPAENATRWGIVVVGAAALGAALAAVLILPLAEFFPHTHRTELDPRDFFGRAVDPREIPRLVFPFLYGSLTKPGAGEPAWATIGYVGLAPLLAAVVAVVRRFRHDARVRFFTIVAAASLLLSLGDATVLGRAAFHIPILNLFRAPGRHLFEFTFSVSVLAGLGVAAVSRGALGRRRSVLLAAGSAGALALSLGLAWAFHPERASHRLAELVATPAVGLSVVHWVLTTGAVLVWLTRPRPGGVLIVAALILDLGTCAVRDRWRRHPPTRETLAAPDTALRYGEILRRTGQRLTPFHGPTGSPASLPPNRSALWRVPSTGGYNPLRLTRPVELADLGNRARMTRARFVDRPRSLDLLAVRYLSIEERTRAPIRAIEESGEWTRVETVGDVHFFERTAPLPRAWIVPATRTMDTESLHETVISGRLPDGTPFDPRTLALVERDVPLAAADVAGEASASITRNDARRVDVRTRSPDPAFLVLSNVHYPGWRAFRDGAAVPLYRCDYAIMGVRIPAGEHTTSFSFRPASLYAGAAISLLTIVGLLIANAFQSRRSRAP